MHKAVQSSFILLEHCKNECGAFKFQYARIILHECKINLLYGGKYVNYLISLTFSAFVCRGIVFELC